MLGMALDPNFPATPDVYVLYTYDAAIGGFTPTWGDGAHAAGPDHRGCLVSARLSRLTAAGNAMTGSEQVLIDDWCQQFPSHSIGSLEFGPDGALYATGGDGASFNYVDYGQTENPCGDPPVRGHVARPRRPPRAARCAARTCAAAGDPTAPRRHRAAHRPATGQGLADNPFAGPRRCQRPPHHRLRAAQPVPVDVPPGHAASSGSGDVGWSTCEEVNRVVTPDEPPRTSAGPATRAAARAVRLRRGQPQRSASRFTPQVQAPSPRRACAYRPRAPRWPRATVLDWQRLRRRRLAFASAQSTYPAAYTGALFFADHNRNCIWAMLEPAPTALPSASLAAARSCPAVRARGPADRPGWRPLLRGLRRRRRAPDQLSGRQPRSRRRSLARHADGRAASPLAVAFDGTGSSDPDPGDALSYAWDLDGDGAYDDAPPPRRAGPTRRTGTFTARLRVTDARGASGHGRGDHHGWQHEAHGRSRRRRPGTTWRVGQSISFRRQPPIRSRARCPDGSRPARSARPCDVRMNYSCQRRTRFARSPPRGSAADELTPSRRPPGSLAGVERLTVVGAPTSAGAYAPGQEDGPAALRAHGLLEALRAGGREVVDAGDVEGFRWRPDPERPRAANAPVVADRARQVAERAGAALAGGGRVLVLGGDCTVGVGTVAALAPAGGGLVYLDRHADLNTPATTIDGALDWMGVAHMLGADGRGARHRRARRAAAHAHAGPRRLPGARSRDRRRRRARAARRAAARGGGHGAGARRRRRRRGRRAPGAAATSRPWPSTSTST